MSLLTAVPVPVVGEDYPGANGANFAVSVLHAYVSRVHHALGGTIVGELGNRTGKKSSRYIVIVDAKTPIRLIPFARQQISSALFVPESAVSMSAAVKAVASGILARRTGQENIIRVDTLPKSAGEATVALLREALGLDQGTNTSKIEFTPSAKRATLVVSFVVQDDGDDSSSSTRYGIADGPACLNLAQCLNHHATKECDICPMDPKTGEDLGRKLPMPSSAGSPPVSRAYWKLRQVVDEILATKAWWNSMADGHPRCGIDLGASPGGWTQALMGARSQGKTASKRRPETVMARMLSIDKGRIAQRVLRLNNFSVTHCAHDFTSDEAAERIAAMAPFSSIECDANIDPPKVLVWIQKTLLAASKLLNAKDHQAESPCVANLFAESCAFVVTLKFPYKSAQSVERNLALFEKSLPLALRNIAGLADADADVSYEIFDLFANSLSERTLVANIGGSSEGKRKRPKVQCSSTFS